MPFAGHALGGEAESLPFFFRYRKDIGSLKNG